MYYNVRGGDVMDEGSERRLNRLSSKQWGNMVELAAVMRECDDEILDGMFYSVPMTRQLYERTREKLKEIGALGTLRRFEQDFREFGT